MSTEDLEAQNSYFKQRLDELTGQTLKADARLSRMSRELRHRRDALALISDLHRRVTSEMEAMEIYRLLLGAVQRSLKMDRAFLLLQREQDAHYQIAAAVGGDAAINVALQIPEELLHRDTFLLVTKSSPETLFIAQVREVMGLNYFALVPVMMRGEVRGLLVSGRQRELKPFYPPLDEHDVNTMAALSGFLGSALTNRQLFHDQRRLADSFRRFVPQQFLEFLGYRSIADVEMGSQVQREMVILFSDIRSFTAISERMTPKENFDFINRYLDFVAPAIVENGGFIDKYIGDAIMALFPAEPDLALKAALGLHQGLARFNAQCLAPCGEPVRIGVGLHLGLLMLGTIGFKERLDTTVIADAVNLASRVEGLTKRYGAGVLLTSALRDSLQQPNDFALRTIDCVRVKGKSEPVQIIENFDCDPEETCAAKIKSLPLFKDGFTAYAMGDFAAAQSIFERILSDAPVDGAAMLLAGRCRHFRAAGPPTDWCGVVALDK